MKARAYALCSLLFGNVLLASMPAIGMSESELLAAKGAPSGHLCTKNKTIYQWNDCRVTVAKGIVTEVQLRDVKAEQAQREHGAKLIAEQKAAQQAREKAEQEKQRAFAAIVAANHNNPQSISRQTEENERRVKARVKERQAALEQNSANVAALRAEISTLRMQLRRAYAAGDKAATFNLDMQLEAKKKQLAIAEKNGKK